MRTILTFREHSSYTKVSFTDVVPLLTRSRGYVCRCGIQLAHVVWPEGGILRVPPETARSPIID